jgi:hypothetical protein
MNIRTLSRRESWMTDAEWRHALRHRRAILRDFAEREVPLTVFIALRLHAYLFALILTQRTENALLVPLNANDSLPTITAEQLEALTAGRDRLLRLLSEIEHGPKIATPEPADEPQPEPVKEIATAFPMTLLEEADPFVLPDFGYTLNRKQRRALARRAA